jgi:hypothetical protein
MIMHNQKPQIYAYNESEIINQKPQINEIKYLPVLDFKHTELKIHDNKTFLSFIEIEYHISLRSSHKLCHASI